MGLSKNARTAIGFVIALIVALTAATVVALILVVSPTSSAPTHAAAARVSRCFASQLTVAPGPGSGAAGSVGQVVHFTNHSHSSCTLSGYPGMQMLGSAGKPLATEVHRGSSVTVPALAVRLVTLRPAGKASFNLGYADATGYGNERCPTSTRVEITAPNDYKPLTIVWRIQPYGGDIPHLECGEITVSPVFAGAGS
ncbi:MAG TPA: DUF4232 domain-containing protein [Solirubrobacteraceae bacterium]|nr:DUF4232 domain-containing protein [Solirubrobacteraceae bacterium]